MPSSKFHRIASSAFVVAALVLAAPAARAQSGDVLRQRELRESGQTRLYDAVAQLRPGWLQLAGDSVAADAVSRVVVFVDGLHQGDVRVLASISTADVLSARLRNAEYVRRTDPRFPRQEFDAAIYVATRTQPRERRRGRFSLSLDPGFSIRGLARVMDDAFTEAGYGSIAKVDSVTSKHFDVPGVQRPPSVGGTVRYDFQPPWGVAVTGHYTARGWVGGYSSRTDSAFSANLESTEGAVLVTREVGHFRVGAGAAYRQVEWNWASGFRQDAGTESMSTSSVGLAAEGLFELPLRAPVFPVVRVLARYYPSEKVEYHGLETNAGGLVLTMNLGVATRF
jgi:hypothetical protein